MIAYLEVSAETRTILGYSKSVIKSAQIIVVNEFQHHEAPVTEPLIQRDGQNYSMITNPQEGKSFWGARFMHVKYGPQDKSSMINFLSTFEGKLYATRRTISDVTQISQQSFNICPVEELYHKALISSRVHNPNKLKGIATEVTWSSYANRGQYLFEIEKWNSPQGTIIKTTKNPVPEDVGKTTMAPKHLLEATKSKTPTFAVNFFESALSAVWLHDCL